MIFLAEYLAMKHVSAMRAQETYRAEADRLLRQDRAKRRGWLHRQTSRILCPAGGFLVAVGERLQQAESPQALSLEGEVASGS